MKVRSKTTWPEARYCVCFHSEHPPGFTASLVTVNVFLKFNLKMWMETRLLFLSLSYASLTLSMQHLLPDNQKCVCVGGGLDRAPSRCCIWRQPCVRRCDFNLSLPLPLQNWSGWWWTGELVNTVMNGWREFLFVTLTFSTIIYIFCCSYLPFNAHYSFLRSALHSPC